jgi:hypothetical protein
MITKINNFSNTIQCRNCDWEWQREDGGNDLYICHKCYHNNEKYYLDNLHKILENNNNLKPKYELLDDKFLLINKKGSAIELLIQDKSKIYGYIELLNKHNYYQVINIAGEKGFGPILYDLTMYILNKPIRPNRSLTSKALNVWLNNYQYRNDINKTKITNDIWNTLDLDNKEVKKYTNIINTLYSLSNIDYDVKSLLDRSDEFKNKMNKILPNWENLRFNQGKLYFNNKYI